MRQAARGPLGRLAALALAGALAIGSLLLWTAVPVASFRAASALATSRGGQLAAALPLTVAAMVAWWIGLSALNSLYARVAGLRPGDGEVRRAGPLEPLLVGSLLLALVAFGVWFFAFARNPPPGIGL